MPMLINLLLASLLIVFTIGVMVTLDASTNLIANIVRAMLRFSRRSKLLTEYILRAYLRYRKTIHKSYINY